MLIVVQVNQSNVGFFGKERKVLNLRNTSKAALSSFLKKRQNLFTKATMSLYSFIAQNREESVIQFNCNKVTAKTEDFGFNTSECESQNNKKKSRFILLSAHRTYMTDGILAEYNGNYAFCRRDTVVSLSQSLFLS